MTQLIEDCIASGVVGFVLGIAAVWGLIRLSDWIMDSDYDPSDY